MQPPPPPPPACKNQNAVAILNEKIPNLDYKFTETKAGSITMFCATVQVCLTI